MIVLIHVISRFHFYFLFDDFFLLVCAGLAELANS